MIPVVLAALLLQGGAPSAHKHGEAHGKPGAANRDPHGPKDLGRYIDHLEDKKRDAYQLPDRVVAALELAPTDVVADLGCGPGYFTRRLARAVPDGVVFAIDVEPAQLDRLNKRLAEDRADNVVPVLAPLDHPRLPPRSVDVVLVVDTYHHFDARRRYLEHVKRALKPGGRLVIVDYHKRPLPVGPPPAHKLSREEVLAELQPAGWKLLEEPTFLPYQYFLILGR